MTELKTLEAVYLALKPRDPESRRKIIEAVHALLEISPGRRPSHSPSRKSSPSQKKK